MIELDMKEYLLVEHELNKLERSDNNNPKSKKTKSVKLKAEQSSKSITSEECYTKSLPTTSGYFSWRERPITTAYLEVLCEKLLVWAKTYEDAYDIDEFFDDNCIWHQQVNAWASDHEFVREAIDQAKRVIGTRRHKSAFKKITDGNIMLKTQHHYKPEWHKTVNEYHSEMKKKEENEKTEMHLHFDAVPHSDIVTLSQGKNEK